MVFHVFCVYVLNAGTRQRHNRDGHTGRATAVADHVDSDAGTGHVLPVGPDTPPVRV